jgi:WD40 repeat protein
MFGGHMTLQISLVHQFDQQQADTWDMHFSFDGQRLISSDGKALYLWRLNEDGSWDYERSLLFRHAAFPCFSPMGDLIAFRDEDKNVRLISVANGDAVAILDNSAATDCAFSPDQRWLITGDTTRNLVLWDLLTYQCSIIPVRFSRFRDDPWEDEAALANETIGSFQFTPDGQRLVFLASSAEGDLHLCYIDPVQKSLVRQKTFPHGSMDLAISSNGKMLATIVSNQQMYSYKEEIYVYDLESLRLLHVFPQTTDERYGLLAFLPDSTRLASCKTDGIVEIFSLASFECIAHFAAHPGLSSHASDPIGGLDWSRTGYIATGGASVFEKDMKKTDFTIKLWKVEDEERQ